MIGALAIAVLAGAGFVVYWRLVEHGYIRYNRWDRRVRGTLRVGQLAPDAELLRDDGTPVRLATFWRERPVILVFGSCT